MKKTCCESHKKKKKKNVYEDLDTNLRFKI